MTLRQTEPQTWRGFAIRPAVNADCAAARELVFGVLREHGLEPDGETTDADLYDIEKSYSDGWFVVVEDENGVIVGSTGLYRLDAETCELRKMYLAPAARGCGLGKHLLELALEQAREMNFRRVVLETAATLQDAIRLYTRYGFRPFTPAHLAARADCAYELEL
jgi:putative acetyltransferase